MTEPNTRRTFIVGLLVAMVIAVIAAQFASGDPDGLEFVAEQEGFADGAADHALSDAPLAGYGSDLTSSSWMNTALAGFLGVLLTLALGYAIFWFARKTNPDNPTTGTT